MRAPVTRGVRVVVWGGGEDHKSFMPPGTLATVDYLLPDYGKIICKLDAPIGPHVNCCLYDSQYGYYWGLASADTHPKDGDVQQAPLVSGAVAATSGETPSTKSGAPDNG